MITTSATSCNFKFGRGKKTQDVLGRIKFRSIYGSKMVEAPTSPLGGVSLSFPHQTRNGNRKRTFTTSESDRGENFSHHRKGERFYFYVPNGREPKVQKKEILASVNEIIMWALPAFRRSLAGNFWLIVESGFFFFRTKVGCMLQ